MGDCEVAVLISHVITQVEENRVWLRRNFETGHSYYSGQCLTQRQFYRKHNEYCTSCNNYPEFCRDDQICVYAKWGHNECLTMGAVVQDYNSLQAVSLQCDKKYDVVSQPLRFGVCQMGSTINDMLKIINDEKRQGQTVKRTVVAAASIAINTMTTIANIAAIGAAVGLFANPFGAAVGLVLGGYSVLLSLYKR